MHRHKIIAQILFMFSILNSVLAAPIERARGEIPGAHGAVAVRVPSGGVVAVLEKRPFAPPAGSNIPNLMDFPGPEHPGPQSTVSNIPNLMDYASPEHPGPQSATGPEHPETQPPTSPEHPGPQSTTGEHPETPPPTSPEHTESQRPTSPEHPGSQPLTSPERPEPQSMRPPEIEEVSGPVYHDASSKEINRPVTENKAPSMPAWREKIMTPEKIKGTKYVAGAALFTTLYLGLLLPDIFRDDN